MELCARRGAKHETDWLPCLKLYPSETDIIQHKTDTRWLFVKKSRRLTMSSELLERVEKWAAETPSKVRCRRTIARYVAKRRSYRCAKLRGSKLPWCRRNRHSTCPKL
jgi:hypothetical protein